jgi:UPF0755 protein
MKINQHKKILALFLVLTLIVFMVSLYLLVSTIPSLAGELFGEPDPTLETSQLIILSMRIIISRKTLFAAGELKNSQQTLLIDTGESAQSVAERLEKMKLISDAQPVIYYWQYKGQDGLIQPGVYLIQSDLSPIVVAQKIVNRSPEILHFGFLQGWRKEEVENLLINSFIFPSDLKIIDIEKTVVETCFPMDLRDITSVEGFLFPGEYQFPIGFSPEKILCNFTEEFFKNLPVGFKELVNENGLTVYEAVILASIVEKEVVLGKEAPIIAGVFINRLNDNMPLQSDPTVQYAISGNTIPHVWWKNPLEISDLDFDSTFNTYLYNGLPPTPISNPGLDSLLAVAYPEKSAFLYFRASCDGSGGHIFSETYQQHLNAACD